MNYANKYGESIRVKTKDKVIEHIGIDRKIGAFYDIAVLEKIEREKSKKRK